MAFERPVFYFLSVPGSVCYLGPMFRRTLLILWMAFLFLTAFRGVAAQFPSPQGYVNDFANVLDGDTRSRLNGLITDLEKKTTVEFAVVTVPSLKGMTVEQYANLLFKQWGIGKKGKDNGLLVLICPKERKMRVEVGYGLEAVITDGLAGSVIRHSFTPAFKQGDYAKGTLEGVTQLTRFVTGADSPQTWKTVHADPKPQDPLVIKIFSTLFFSVFVVIGLTAIGFGITDKVIFLIIWGSMFGGIPLCMAFLEDGTLGWNVWTLIVLGGLAFISGIWLGIRYPKAVKLARARKGNGWIWGATSGGSGGSSGGGSFGGGSSGGGGASGSW